MSLLTKLIQLTLVATMPSLAADLAAAKCEGLAAGPSLRTLTHRTHELPYRAPMHIQEQRFLDPLNPAENKTFDGPPGYFGFWSETSLLIGSKATITQTSGENLPGIIRKVLVTYTSKDETARQKIGRIYLEKNDGEMTAVPESQIISIEYEHRANPYAN